MAVGLGLRLDDACRDGQARWLAASVALVATPVALVLGPLIAAWRGPSIAAHGQDPDDDPVSR